MGKRIPRYIGPIVSTKSIQVCDICLKSEIDTIGDELREMFFDDKYDHIVCEECKKADEEG